MNRFGVFLATLMLAGALAPAQTTQPATEKVLSEVHFAEVPLPDAVKFLAEKSGENIVLLANPGVDPAQISVTFDLKNVTPSQVMGLITKLPGHNMEVDTLSADQDAGRGILIIKLLDEAQNPAGHYDPQTGQTVPPDSPTLVLDLSQQIPTNLPEAERQKKAEQITSLVNSTLEAAQLGKPEPKVYFHPETGILVVHGSAEQRALLKDLADQLKRGSEAANTVVLNAQTVEFSNTMEKTKAELANRANQAETMARQLEKMRDEREQLLREVAELKARLEQGAISQDEFRKLRAQSEDLRDEARQLRQQLQQLKGDGKETPPK